MKNVLSIALAIFVAALPAAAEDTAPPINEISAAKLNSIKVIGELGIPLGQIAQIEATIISGDSSQMKAYQGRYLLKVTTVDGKTLGAESVFEFSKTPGSQSELASTDFELFELKTGKKAEQLTAEQITKLREGYLGTRLSLLAYESGGFSGIPKNWPKDMMPWQGQTFHFGTRLMVVGEQPIR